MILKVHVKYLMDWINSAFVVLGAGILSSACGDSADVQKRGRVGMLPYDISLCASSQKRDACVLRG